MNSPNPKPQLPAGLKWRSNTIFIETSIRGRRIRKSTGTNDPVKARELLETLRSSIRLAEMAGIPGPDLRPKKQLRQFVSETLDEMRADRLSAKTLTRYGNVMERFTAFAKRHQGADPSLIDITRDVVHEFKLEAQRTPRSRNGHPNAQKRIPSSRTIANELDVIRAFMRRAVARGLIDRNPEAGIGRAKGAYQNRVRWLSDPQITALLAAAESWDDWHQAYQRKGRLLRLALDLYLRTGMRAAELQHLTLDAVPPPGARSGHIHIAPRDCALTAIVPVLTDRFEQLQAGKVKNHWRHIPGDISRQDPSKWAYDPESQLLSAPCHIEWKPKTSSRHIPVPRHCIELIDEIHAERQIFLDQGQDQQAFKAKHGIAEPPWLVPDLSGLPWRWNLPNIMAELSTQAGIDPVVRTHDLRHTFATRLRQKSIPLETVKELLGHADIKETMMYAHYQDEEGLRAMEKLF